VFQFNWNSIPDNMEQPSKIHVTTQEKTSTASRDLKMVFYCSFSAGKLTSSQVVKAIFSSPRFTVGLTQRLVSAEAKRS